MNEFASRYGHEPEGIWFAPGRVNLMGGPDYTEVFVLPFALGAGVTVAAARRRDRKLALTSRQIPREPAVADLDTLEPGSVPGWAAYPAGVAWALGQAGYPVGGADLAVDADLPAGAGLSSSAALECATALALTELYGLDVPRTDLAVLTRRAENEFVGVPSGIMDQMAALTSRAGHALLLDCRTGEATPVPLDPAAAGLTLLIIDTGARRAHTDGRYAERRRACDQAAHALGVRTLRDASDTTRLSDPSLRQLADHVIAENRRVLHAADLLRASTSSVPPGQQAPAPGHQAPAPGQQAPAPGALAAFGALLTASHRSVRDRFGMSWPEADLAVEAALEAGAAGARMTGGGFGGCVIALVPADRRAELQSNVADRLFPNVPRFLPAVPSAAARRLSPVT